MADLSGYKTGSLVDVFRLGVEVVSYCAEARELTVVDETGEEFTLSEDDTTVTVKKTPRAPSDAVLTAGRLRGIDKRASR
jgi:hypothetical protein